MAIDPAGVKMNAVTAGSLRAHWKFFMGEGVVLLILGLAAIIVPQVASVAIAILIGWSEAKVLRGRSVVSVLEGQKLADAL